MIRNDFYCNTQTFYAKEAEEIKERLKSLYEITKCINKLCDAKIYYDKEIKNLLGTSIFIENKDIKNLFLIFLSNNKEVEKISGHDIISKDFPDTDFSIVLNSSIDNEKFLRCFISPSLGESWESDKINIRVDDDEINLSNIYDEKSTFNFLKNSWAKKVLLDKIVCGETISHLGENKYDAKSIVFHDDFSKDMLVIPRNIKDKVTDIFTLVIFGEKVFENYNYHAESETVKKNSKLRKERDVKFDGETENILMHLKINQQYSVYIEVNNNQIHVGRISNHLTTKNY